MQILEWIRFIAGIALLLIGLIIFVLQLLGCLYEGKAA